MRTAEGMERKSAILGFVAGVVLTIPALLLAIASSGAGHGDYAIARALFPIPMLLSFNGAMGVLTLISGVIQFPLYGYLTGAAYRSGRFGTLMAVLALHMVAVAVCFSGVLSNFD